MYNYSFIPFSGEISKLFYLVDSLKIYGEIPQLTDEEKKKYEILGEVIFIMVKKSRKFYHQPPT